ncbi:MAG TPA: hypothetical protein VFE13_14455 [Caulobacteraceae bacterium]|nr:hypothetical protein [Caulobacteraceae bacterium]
MAFARGAWVGVGLLLGMAGSIAEAAPHAPDKTPAGGPNVQQKAVPRATATLPAGPVGHAPPPPPRKAADVKVLFLSQDAPFRMAFGRLAPHERKQQAWQLSGEADVIVYLRRDYASASSAEMSVYAPGGGAAVCVGRAARDSPSPTCTIQHPRPGVYAFSLANTSEQPGEFSLSLSLPISATEALAKALAKSPLARPPPQAKK